MFDSVEYKITLRVIPDRTMQNPMILGRDFMKVARLSLNVGSEIIDIMNIELHRSDTHISSQNMKINDDLSNKLK